MSTTNVPIVPKAKILQKSIMTPDLDDVLIGRSFSFTPASSPDSVLERVGGDAAKFLEVLNAGLEAVEMAAARDLQEGWFVLSEDKKLTATPASPKSAGDPKAIAALINNFAKVSTPNWSNLNAAEKNAARDVVKDILKSTPAMLDRLKASAGAGSSDEEDSE